jgi:hypothetical protein
MRLIALCRDGYSFELGTAHSTLRLFIRHCEGKAMNMSEIVTRADALNERSCLVTRSVEPEQSPVLTLVDTAEQICGMPDPLIQALVDKLPKPNTVWPIDDRAKWLKAAAMAFNLIYKNIEGERCGFQPKLQQAPANLKSVG